MVNMIQKVIYELKMFIKNNVVILSFLVLSVLIVIKNGELPILSNIPVALKLLFVKPKDDTITAFIFDLLENISLAYIASCVFYFVVDYFPQRKKERKAYCLIQNELRIIYGELSYLIRMFLFEAGINKEPRKIIKDKVTLSKMCNINLDRRDRHVKILHCIDGKSNSCSYIYNIFNDSVQKIKNIENSIENIYNKPLSHEIEMPLYEIIDSIWNSRFLRMVKAYGEGEYVEAPGRIHVFLHLDNSFRELIKCYIKFEAYNFGKIDYKIEAITETEWEKQNEESVLMLDRGCFLNLPFDKLRSKVNDILKVELTDSNFDKITGVLCELLVAYDYSPQKHNDLLPLGKCIAVYLKTYEGDEDRVAIAAINYLQILKRMGTATKKDVREVNWIFTRKGFLPDYVVLGALILVKNYKEAESVFDSLSDEMKDFFIALPVYRLWPAPPVPPNIEPIDFRKL